MSLNRASYVRYNIVNICSVGFLSAASPGAWLGERAVIIFKSVLKWSDRSRPPWLVSVPSKGREKPAPASVLALPRVSFIIWDSGPNRGLGGTWRKSTPQSPTPQTGCERPAGWAQAPGTRSRRGSACDVPTAPGKCVPLGLRKSFGRLQVKAA